MLLEDEEKSFEEFKDDDWGSLLVKKDKLMIIFLIATSIITLYLLKDYITVIFSSFLLAYFFYPLHKRTREMLGNKISALLISILILLIILFFFAYILSNIFVFLKKIPKITQVVPRINLTYIKDIEEMIYEKAIYESARYIGYIPRFLLNIFVLLTLTYYILCDGEKFILFLGDILPKEYGEMFVNTISRILKAIFYGHLLTAVLQGIISTIVYVSAGVPYFLFFGMLTLLISFIGITPAVVYLPVSLMLFFVKNFIGGIFVLFVGIFVVSTIDNIIKPHFASKFYDLHPAIFLLSMLGGISIFGFVGTFIGPVIVGILKAAIVSYRGLKDDKAES